MQIAHDASYWTLFSFPLQDLMNYIISHQVENYDPALNLHQEIIQMDCKSSFIIPPVAAELFRQERGYQALLLTWTKVENNKTPRKLPHRGNKVVIKVTRILLFIFAVWHPVLRNREGGLILWSINYSKPLGCKVKAVKYSVFVLVCSFPLSFITMQLGFI